MAHDKAFRERGKCGYIKKDGTPCKLPAGSGTQHKGEGCCRRHGGNGGRPATTGERIGEGKYKRYDVLTSPVLRALADHFEADPDPLNLLSEVALLRGLITNFANEYGEYMPALLAWHASFDADHRSASRAYFAEWVAKLKTAVKEEMSWQDDRAVDEILEEVELPKRPYPLDHCPRPRKVVDLIQLGKFIVDVGTLADKIQKARENASISMVEVNAHWQALGFELVRGAREVVKDEGLCAELIGNVQRRWDAIPPPGHPLAGKERS